MTNEKFIKELKALVNKYYIEEISHRVREGIKAKKKSLHVKQSKV